MRLARRRGGRTEHGHRSHERPEDAGGFGAPAPAGRSCRLDHSANLHHASPPMLGASLPVGWRATGTGPPDEPLGCLGQRAGCARAVAEHGSRFLTTPTDLRKSSFAAP